MSSHTVPPIYPLFIIFLSPAMMRAEAFTFPFLQFIHLFLFIPRAHREMGLSALTDKYQQRRPNPVGSVSFKLAPAADIYLLLLLLIYLFSSPRKLTLPWEHSSPHQFIIIFIFPALLPKLTLPWHLFFIFILSWVSSHINSPCREMDEYILYISII